MDEKFELDPRLNVLPEKMRPSAKSPYGGGCADCQSCGEGFCKGSVHLLGVGGVAMCALAGLLKDAGYKVSGSDQALYPPMSDVLKAMGIEVFEGYEKMPVRPDLAVVGNVVTRKFPVLRDLRDWGLNYLSLPQTLNRLFMNRTKNLVVAGCHGKTSTSALAAKVWDAGGLAPGFMVGGDVLDFPHAWRVAEGDWFVIEGDEYDCAFFNKVPKFIHYRPHTVILTSVEFDHADIYPDLDAVIEAYESLMDVMVPEGRLIANGDDALVRKIAENSPAPIEFYGEGEGNNWRVQDVAARGLFTDFTLKGPGDFCERLSISRPGRYNAMNAAAVSAAYLGQPGASFEALSGALASFQGVRRRQEFLGDFGGVIYIDDFAHHPTAVAETLAGLRAAFPERRVLAAFEPRSNTSRRAIFQDDYAKSFFNADRVFLKRTHEPGKAPEGDRLDCERLAAEIGPKAALYGDGAAAAEAILAEARAGDVIVTMSNGGFDGLRGLLCNALSGRAQ